MFKGSSSENKHKYCSMLTSWLVLGSGLYKHLLGFGLKLLNVQLPLREQRETEHCQSKPGPSALNEVCVLHYESTEGY